jgi:hypothetical protein
MYEKYGVFEKQGSSKKELREEIKRLNEQLHLENRYASFNVLKWLLSIIKVDSYGKIENSFFELIDKMKSVYGFPEEESIDSWAIANISRTIKIERRMKDLQRINSKSI